MERICPNCKAMVEGDGQFCPECGAALPGAVDLTKPAGNESTPINSNPVNPAPTPVNPNYSGSAAPNYSQPIYSQNNNVAYTENMTLGQWVGTILLTSCLGIISIILLFVWGFGDTYEPKKTYCRAMLVVQAIMLGISLLTVIGVCACGGITALSVLNEFGSMY